jgi:hypothetical protein
MTTLMVAGAGRTRNLQDLVFMIQCKDFCAVVVSVLCPCVFLEMLLDLPREHTWKMGPIKRMQEFDPIFFQETFGCFLKEDRVKSVMLGGKGAVMLGGKGAHVSSPSWPTAPILRAYKQT